MSIAVLPFTPSINDLHLNTINGVLGNSSQTGVNDRSSPQEKVQAHLRYVLNILESGQFAPSNLIASQTHNRRNCINILRDYALGGVFPHRFEYPDPSATHRPCFKDDANNVCAVGYIIEKTAGMQVVDQINRLFKFAYIRDMDLTLIEDWKYEHGFSLIELAMIQPSYSFERDMYSVVKEIRIITHKGVRCDICGVTPITGVRYKCVNCPNFDMCANCESVDGNHNLNHVFLKLKFPITTEPGNTSPLLPNITVNASEANPLLGPAISFPDTTD